MVLLLWGVPKCDFPVGPRMMQTQIHTKMRTCNIQRRIHSYIPPYTHPSMRSYIDVHTYSLSHLLTFMHTLAHTSRQTGRQTDRRTCLRTHGHASVCIHSRHRFSIDHFANSECYRWCTRRECPRRSRSCSGGFHRVQGESSEGRPGASERSLSSSLWVSVWRTWMSVISCYIMLYLPRASWLYRFLREGGFPQSDWVIPLGNSNELIVPEGCTGGTGWSSRSS